MTQKKNQYDKDKKKHGYWEEKTNYWDSHSACVKPATQRGTYVNGKKEGLWETFISNDGYVFRIYNYKNGKLCGEYRVMHIEEKIVRITGNHIEEGKKDGPWKHYRNDGTLRQIYNYKNGALFSPIKDFDPSGKIERELLYIF